MIRRILTKVLGDSVEQGEKKTYPNERQSVITGEMHPSAKYCILGLPTSDACRRQHGQQAIFEMRKHCLHVHLVLIIWYMCIHV